MKHTDDEIKLVKKAARGNSEAYELLIIKYKHYIYRIAYSNTGDENLALDAVQESIIKAYRAISSLKNADNFSTWITRIVINSARDITRKRKRDFAGNIDDEVSLAAEESDIDAMLDVRDAIMSLPENYRRVIELKYYQGLKTGEISEELDMPLGTVSTYLARGKSLLREKLTTL